MPLKRITAEQFQLLAQSQKALDEDTIVVKADAGLIKAASEGRRAAFKLSSAAVDRDRDVINQNGWRLDNYLKNPVVLWGHQYGMPPVANCPTIQLKGGDLYAEAEFFDAETYAWADTIYRLVKAGGLRACSVGFKPLKYNYNAERGGVDIEEQELLEWSIVSVPANPEALVQLSATLADGDQLLKDFVKGCERVLDQYYGCEGIWIPRAQVEKAFEAINKSGVLAPKETVSVSLDGREIVETIVRETRLVDGAQKAGGEAHPSPLQTPESIPRIEKDEGAACGEEPYLEIINDAVVLELTEEYLDVDAKQLHEILTRVVKESLCGVLADAQASVQEYLDYQRGRVR